MLFLSSLALDVFTTGALFVLSHNLGRDSEKSHMLSLFFEMSPKEGHTDIPRRTGVLPVENERLDAMARSPHALPAKRMDTSALDTQTILPK